MVSRAISIVLFSVFLLGSAHAAHIRVLCPGALKAPMETLIPDFERATGHIVEVVFDIINAIAGRIREGQSFDLAMESPAQWEALAAERKIDPSVRANIAGVKWALYVKMGAPKPNIDTVDALKQALLNANSIAYSSVQGPIRAYQAKVTEQLGLTQALEPKARYGRTPRPGEVGVTFELVMNGEAELGFGTISEILARPSLEMVSPMPPELQSSITFVSALPMNTREPAAAKELVVFLALPEARAVLKRSGLEPDQP